MPFFSIIVPVYNCSKFLDETITSVYSQSFHDWELIVIDDGSKDNSYTIAKEWERRDSRIKAIRHDGGLNKGVSATRNLGLSSATGEWVAFLDADDTWLPHKLQRSYDVLTKFINVGFFYHSLKLIDQDSNPIIHSTQLPVNHNNFIYGEGIAGITHNPFKKVINKKFDPPTSSVVIKRALLSLTNGFNEKVSFTEDFQLWLEVLQFTDLYFTNDSLGYYRISNIQWNARSNIEQKIGRRLILYSNLLDRCQHKNKSIVTYYLITLGFVKLYRSLFSISNVNTKRIRFETTSIIRDKRIKIHYKTLLVIVLIKEIFITPIRLLYSVLK